MPKPVTAYRVFIASPGGLESERAAFRAVLGNYNDSDAIEREVIFLPIGWENTPGGVGRPQHLINEDVRQCDFFVMVLWDKWGSAPQREGEGPYSSGSEEEYTVALECHGQKSMREIVILFKDVDSERRKDAGPQLRGVLDFKKKLEEEKSFFFESFDNADAFSERLRRHLARWLRTHEGGAGAPQSASASPPVELQQVALEAATRAPEQSSSELVRGAEQLAKAGHITEAEQVFAEAVSEQVADLDTLNRYGAFLVEKGSLGGAEEIFVRLGDLARQREKPDWELASLNNLARLYGVQGLLEKAAESYAAALAISERTHPGGCEEAASLNNLAEVYTKLRRFDEAEQLFRRALKIQGVTVAA